MKKINIYLIQYISIKEFKILPIGQITRRIYTTWTNPMYGFYINKILYI